MGTQFQRLPIEMPLGGLVLNVPSEAVVEGGLLQMDNMVIRNGELTKVTGWLPVGTVAGGSVNLVRSVYTGPNTLSTVVATGQFIYQVRAGVPTPLNTTPLTVAAGDRLDMDTMNGVTYFSDKQDGLISWDGVSPLAPVITGGVQGSFLAQFALHLLLGNLASASPTDTTAQLTVAGSGLLQANGTFDWDFANSNSDALVLLLSDNGDQIQRLLRLNQSTLAVYKESCIYLVSYSASGYSVSLAVPATGVLAPWSVVDLGGTHVFFGQDDIYSFNGSVNPAGFGARIWKYIIGLVDPTQQSNIWAFRDLRYKEIVFGLPSTGKALIWNYEYDCFSTRDFPFNACGLAFSATGGPSVQGGSTLDQFQGRMDDYFETGIPAAIDFPLLAGDTTGNLWTMDDTQQTANGQPIAATIEHGDTALVDAKGNPLYAKWKEAEGIDLDSPTITGSPLQVFVCARRTLADPVAYFGPFNVVQGQRTVFFTSGLVGVWFRIKFVKPDGSWTYHGFSWRYRVRGIW